MHRWATPHACAFLLRCGTTSRTSSPGPRSGGVEGLRIWFLAHLAINARRRSAGCLCSPPFQVTHKGTSKLSHCPNPRARHTQRLCTGFFHLVPRARVTAPEEGTEHDVPRFVSSQNAGYHVPRTMGMAILCFILKPWHAELLYLPPRSRNTSTRAIVFVQP